MKQFTVIQLVSARDEWGGMEQHAKNLVVGLKERDHKVMVVARPVDFVIQAFQEDCEVFTFPIRGAADIESIWGLAKLINRENVDIIHTHTSRDAWTALFATYFAGRGKVVTTRHMAMPAKRDFVHRWFYRQLGAITCISQWVRDTYAGESFLKNWPRLVTIYPGFRVPEVDTVGNQVQQLREKLAAPDEVLLGYVGRVTREKGITNLLEAVAQLKQWGRKFRVVIAGKVSSETPDYEQEMRALVSKLGIEEQVHFYGFTKDVDSIMQAIDVLVAPSITTETFGLVLCEALVWGKPVVSTNTGAQGEIVQDGLNGYIIPSDDSASLAKALDKLVIDREKAEQMGENGRRLVLEKFTREKVLQALEECYWSCLELDERKK